MDNQQVSFSLTPIPHYGNGSNYFFDIDGNIYSTTRTAKPRMLKSRKHYGKSKNPYMRVKLSDASHLVHRIIASSIIGRKLSADEQVNHIDGNTTNNNVCNLEVVSHKENVKHAKNNGLYCSGREWHKARETSTTIP